MALTARVVVALVALALGSAVTAAVAWPAPVYPAPLEDGSAIVDTHAERLETAGSFTYRDTTGISVNGTLEVNRTTVARFDTVAGAGLVRRFDSAGEYAVYGDGQGSSFERRASPDGSVSYGHPLAGAAQVNRYRKPGIAPLLGDVEYTYVGTARVDGVRVHEYAATTPEQVAGAVGLDSTAPAVETTVDLRVFVSDAGIVRRMTILVVQRDGERTRTLNSTLAYTDVGETDVTEPGWVETARERTGPAR